jgi:hypothetical protein
MLRITRGTEEECMVRTRRTGGGTDCRNVSIFARRILEKIEEFIVIQGTAVGGYC